MLILKCFLGAILGAIAGFIATLLGGLIIWFIVGLIMWNSSKGENVANLVAPLFFYTGIIIGIIIPIREEAKRKEDVEKRKDEQRKQEEQEERLKAKQAQDAITNECTSLTTLLNTSESTFLSLRELVATANTHLDKAEREFKEGVFAPFWDEVEHATNMLAAYHQGVNTIDSNAAEYTRRSSKLSVSMPRFNIPKGKLPDARPIAERLSNIVRKAQKDFQFATIYEQRKTNQLLYAGFGTLATAIDRMQNSIVDSLENLSTSLNTTLDDLVITASAQADMLSTLTDQVTSAAEAQREFNEDSLDESKRQSRMLDNIQRHKKPFP